MHQYQKSTSYLSKRITFLLSELSGRQYSITLVIKGLVKMAGSTKMAFQKRCGEQAEAIKGECA
jgi:hypothetical protein